MCWRGFKTETSIKSIRLGVDGVCQQCTDTCLIGNADRARNSVLQHTEAQPTLLVIQIHSKPGQNDQRDRILPHATPNSLRGIQCVDLADRQAVVPSDSILVTGHKGARRAAALRLAGMMQQPLRVRRFSAVKRFQSVRRPQRLRGQNIHLPAQTGGRENKWANPGLSDSGRSSMSRSAWYWLPETMNRR